MKKYPCYLSLDRMCEYGGNKIYGRGYFGGTASFCRKDKKWVSNLKCCPMGYDKLEKEATDTSD